MEPINPHGFLAPFAPIVLLVQYDKQVLILLCLCSEDYSNRGVRLSWIFPGSPLTFVVLNLTHAFFSVCIYCVLNNTCL